MKKSKWGVSLGMTVLFAIIVFCSLSLSCWASVWVLYFLVETDIVDLANALEPHVWSLLTIFVTISIPVGLVVALAATKIPLRPIRELIDGMDRLASGKFDTRIQVGRIMRKYPPFVEMCDSFNELARELENTELLRSDFINNFSHEFKTPIVSIAGFAKLLRRGDLTEEQREEYLAIIEEESKRLSHIATNALNLTKLENMAILTDVTRFNLSEQLRSCVLLLESKWSKKDLEWELDFDEVEISGNEEMLKQIWINLVENAVKFAVPESVISIAIRETPELLAVDVSNVGPDIPEASRKRIFQKFYQADESHNGEGNGIGLAIVKLVARLHDGTVSVDCAGGKTTFTVKLPKKG